MVLMKSLRIRNIWSKMLVAIIGVALCATAAILISSLPAGAQERAEKRIKNMVAEEFENTKEVKLKEQHQGLYGESASYVVYDDKGNASGFVAEDISTGDITAIGHSYELVPAEARISLGNAKNKALEYLSKWNHKIDADFVLVKEELCERWGDIGGKRGYIYQFEWRRRVVDIYIPDGCYIEIDAINGDIILCCFPKRNCQLPNTQDIEEAIITKDEAIGNAKAEIPSLEEYCGIFPSIEKTRMQITENAEKYFEPVNGKSQMTWRVEIAFEFNPVETEKNDDEALYSKVYFITIDAANGKVLAIDQTE
jgi:hypothetical protein